MNTAILSMERFACLLAYSIGLLGRPKISQFYTFSVDGNASNPSPRSFSKANSYEAAPVVGLNLSIPAILGARNMPKISPSIIQCISIDVIDIKASNFWQKCRVHSNANSLTVRYKSALSVESLVGCGPIGIPVILGYLRRILRVDKCRKSTRERDVRNRRPYGKFRLPILDVIGSTHSSIVHHSGVR